mmetsp:Transcript_12116/g.30493  ORF Transcript_12116/g.30493 Transcript_12116/m.30493 type:complete len:226 (+) Transcript_12116:504-1181(+)
MFVEGCTLCLHECRAGLLGVASCASTILLEVHLDPSCTHGLDLIAYVAHIPCTNLCAKSLGGAHGSEPGHATAQDHAVGRRILPCSRDLWRVEALEGVGCLDDRTVPSKLRLRRQHVQLLRDGYPRNGGGVNKLYVRLRRRLNDLLSAGKEAANPTDDSLATELRQLGHWWGIDREEELAIVDDRRTIRNCASGRHVCRIGEASGIASTLLHRHSVTVLDEGLCD